MSRDTNTSSAEVVFWFPGGGGELQAAVPTVPLCRRKPGVAQPEYRLSPGLRYMSPAHGLAAIRNNWPWTDTLSETDLEEMAMCETEDTKVFQKFKKKIAPEPHQVVRYSRGGSPLWVSSQHVPSDQDIPPCTCGAKRVFEIQVMPQLLNSLCVDSKGASIDWGTVAVYTCSASCNHDNEYCPEFIWKQDFTSDQQTQMKHS
ncbi:programmed cell death protein 2 [Lates japonicus]|uniref:Programmed cell death protein 2 n=1 Tax=Lates japonicus TaxID=270547 RepID=A0AAD3R749_LATJO|nr:programmed cell death protein 2 [Lates japonicus]